MHPSQPSFRDTLKESDELENETDALHSTHVPDTGAEPETLRRINKPMNPQMKAPLVNKKAMNPQVTDMDDHNVTSTHPRVGPVEAEPRFSHSNILSDLRNATLKMQSTEPTCPNFFMNTSLMPKIALNVPRLCVQL